MMNKGEINGMVKYHKLFEVRFFHQYYDAFTSKDFEIVPAPATVANIASFGLIFKQTREGFIVLYKEEKERLLASLKQEINLDFAVIARNRHFETFSNLSSQTEKRKYIFSNKSYTSPVGDPVGDKENPKSDQIKLHINGFVDEKNVCLHCYGYNNLIPGEWVEEGEFLLQQAKEVIFNGQVDGSKNFGAVLGNSFGACEVMLKGSGETIPMYYLPPSFSQAFCIITLAIGGAQTGLNEVKGKEYQIRFESRPVQWNYFFISGSGKYYQHVNLFAGKEKLAFSTPVQVTLVNGQKATKVMSEADYPLQQRYTGQPLFAELEEEITESAAETVKKKVSLPSPDVTRIKGTIVQKSERHFSDMYIYL